MAEKAGAVADTKPDDAAAATAAAAAATAAGDTKTKEGAVQTPEEIAAAKVADEKAAADKLAADAEAAAKAGKKPEGDKSATTVPDKYELSLPAGSESWLDESDLTAFAGMAKAEGWTNEQAQERVNRHADALVAQSEAFRAATEKDPDYGGDKLQETQRLAQLALDKVRPAGTPRGDAFRRILAKTGWGNHVEVVSFLADLGKMAAEDRPLEERSAGAGGKKEKDPTSLYDHPSSKALDPATK